MNHYLRFIKFGLVIVCNIVGYALLLVAALGQGQQQALIATGIILGVFSVSYIIGGFVGAFAAVYLIGRGNE